LDQLVPVPSLFFIGRNGVPLEVVAGEVNVPELLQRITSVLEKNGKVVPGKVLKKLLTGCMYENYFQRTRKERQKIASEMRQI
jgi:hypothetical protein